MAADIGADLRLSSSYFQHLLNSIPKQHVYDEDMTEKINQDPTVINSLKITGVSDPGLKEKFHAKLEQLKVKKAKTEKELEKIRLRRKMQKEKKSKRNKKQKVASVIKGENQEKTKKDVPKATFNDKGNVLFSKFDLAESTGSKKKLKRGLPTGKNYKMMLQKVEKQKEKLQKLEDNDKDAAKTAKEKLLWKTAIAKAEGVKVKDDEAYLKLALKKKEKLKQKRQKTWNKREKELQHKMRKQQEKRKENIDKKKQGRRDTKIKRAQKRGRVVF